MTKRPSCTAEFLTPENEIVTDASPLAPSPLRRVLGLWALVFYGLGTIVGAGIYVLIGTVAGRAGMAAPVAFLLSGAAAALTGLCYAELVARFPEAAGEAVYVKEGLGSALLSRATGLGLILVAIVASASIAKGSAGYVLAYVAVPDWLAGAAVVAVFTGIAAIGVAESVRIAVILTVIEIGGLILVMIVGATGPLEGAPFAEAMLPRTADAWSGVFAGAFLAFFAFLGFDTLANMAEEARDVRRTLPRAILLAVALSTLLYIGVSVAVVLALPPAQLAAAPAPLVTVLERADLPFARHFAAIGLLATSNGVLIEIILVARLAYGMARRGLAPRFFAAVHPRTQTPLRATVAAGAVMLILVIGVPFEALVFTTSALMLLVFIAVNASLWRLKRRRPQPDLPFIAPAWAPPAALAICVALLVASVFL